MPREAAHVQLVDHGGGKRALQRDVALPVVGVVVGGHALGRLRVVAPRHTGCGTAVARGQRDRAAVGVEQHLPVVESLAAVGVEGPERAEVP